MFNMLFISISDLVSKDSAMHFFLETINDHILVTNVGDPKKVMFSVTWPQKTFYADAYFEFTGRKIALKGVELFCLSAIQQHSEKSCFI